MITERIRESEGMEAKNGDASSVCAFSKIDRSERETGDDSEPGGGLSLSESEFRLRRRFAILSIPAKPSHRVGFMSLLRRRFQLPNEQPV
jgi:hypothetical protein